MSELSVTERLQNIMRAILGEPELIVSPELSAKDVKGWDSLKHVELILAIQEEFGIRFRAREISDVENAGELTTLLLSKLGKA